MDGKRYYISLARWKYKTDIDSPGWLDASPGHAINSYQDLVESTRKEDIKHSYSIKGEERLAGKVLAMVSVMA